MNTRHIVLNVAVGLAILSAPAMASAQGTGDKTTNKAKDKADKAADKTKDEAGKAADKTKDEASKAKDKTKDEADKAKDKTGKTVETGGSKAKAAADEKGPLEGTSAQAAAREDAAAPTKSPAVPEVAPNTPAARFGARSQIAISSDVGLSIENTSLSGVDGSTTTLRLHPALDYFVIDNLSIGGFVGLDYLSTTGGHSTSFSIGPRVGYNIAFADRFSVWPKVGLSFASTSQTSDVSVPGGGTTSQSTNNTALALNLFVPVMFHPVEHFFLGLGPALDVDMTGESKATTIGGRLSIGGWF